MTRFHSFCWLSNIPLHVYVYYVCIYQEDVVYHSSSDGHLFDFPILTLFPFREYFFKYALNFFCYKLSTVLSWMVYLLFIFWLYAVFCWFCEWSRPKTPLRESQLYSKRSACCVPSFPCSDTFLYKSGLGKDWRTVKEKTCNLNDKSCISQWRVLMLAKCLVGPE